MFKLLKPPSYWKFPVLLAVGIFFGLGVFVLHISNAPSYLSDKPETCVNCHIMAPQYATWNHSSHREVAHCNDCHVPHNNFFNKYYFKAKDGLRHATVFTLRKEPQVIFIRDEGSQVVHQNCVRCHEQQLMDARESACISDYKKSRTARPCWECHREVPHGRVNSLSSTPHAQVPLPESPVPKWIQELSK